MLRPPSGRTRMLRFAIAGIPVEVDLTFFLMPVLFTFGTGMPVPFVVLLGAVIFVSILWHELGHAFAFRKFGLQPSITLYGLGGLASAPGNLTPARDVVVSFAGPAAGFLLGAAVYLTLGRGEFVYGIYDDPVAFATWLAVYANIFWTLVNLLPMLPLDGGRVMAALFRGATDGGGRQPTLLISSAVGAAAGWWAYQNGYLFAAILAGIFTIGNITEFQSERASGGSKSGSLAKGFRALEAGDFRKAAIIGRRNLAGARAAKSAAGSGVLLLWAYALGGKVDEAASLIDEYLREIMPDPLLEEHAVRAAGGTQEAVRAMKGVYEASPGAATAGYYARALVEGGKLDEAAAFLKSGGTTLFESPAASVVISGLVKDKRYGNAAELAQLYFDATADPQAAYAIATIWALAQQKPSALAWLRTAVDSGFADGARFDEDPLLETLRDDGDFRELRRRLERA